MGSCRFPIRGSRPSAIDSVDRSRGCCHSAAMRCRCARPNWGPADPPRRPRSPEADPMAPQNRPVPGPGILDIAPYIGGESKAAGVERPIRLASNESALGPSPKAIAAYRALAEDIHRYPDGGAAELRAALGRHHGLDPERIVCGSGSDELIG